MDVECELVWGWKNRRK